MSGKIGSMVRGVSKALHLNSSSGAPQLVQWGSEQQGKITTVITAGPPGSPPPGLQNRITFPLLKLPKEALDVFFRCLKIKEVLAFSQVCKDLSSLALNTPLYKQLQQRDLTIQQNVSNGIYSVDIIQGNEIYMFPFVIGEEKLYFCGNKGEIGIRDLKTRQLLKPIQAHRFEVMCLAISGEILCSGNCEGEIKVWNTKTRKCKRTLQGPNASVCCIVVENGKVYASFADCNIWVWDIKTGKCLATCGNGQDAFNALVIRDGKVCTTSNENQIHIMEMEKEKRLFTLKGHQNAVNSLIFIGKKLCSGSLDQTIKVWDGDTGDCLATLKGHQNMVNSLVEFRGKLCSSSHDMTIKFWDIEKAECLFTLQGHEYEVFPLYVDKDKLYSGSLDQTIRVWDFTADHRVVFRELVGLLKSGQEDAIEQALVRYSRMSEKAKNAIDAQCEKNPTPMQLATAIEHYIQD